jgi:molecular chaperone GrpE
MKKRENEEEMKKEKEVKEQGNKDEKENKHTQKKSEKKEVQKLKEKIKKLEAEKEEIKDSFIRKVAEFENYKRRTENDQLNLIKYAAEPFIVSVLQVYDDLERSLKHAEESDNNDSLKEGLKLVFNKFTKILEEQGVEKIKAKGEPFDFNLHEALMQQPAEGVPPHTVLEEVEPGYKYKDKVIRHAKVIVSQEVAESGENKSKENEDEGND